MENSAYVPNASHLSSPALVVFSQAASGLQDALRIQRPFNPQVILYKTACVEYNLRFVFKTWPKKHLKVQGM